MFREMRRQDRKIKDVEAVEILKKCEYGILSTVGENGYAYGVPINYVYLNDNIYFHSAVEGSKLDNIRNNNKVSFCVVGETEPIPEKFATRYESVIVFGRAAEVYGDEKYEALIAIIDKYSNPYKEAGKTYIKNADNQVRVVKICIENITGKARK